MITSIRFGASVANRVLPNSRLDYLVNGGSPSVETDWVDFGVAEADPTGGIVLTPASPVFCSGIRIIVTGSVTTARQIDTVQARIASVNWELASNQQSLEGVDYNFEPNFGQAD